MQNENEQEAVFGLDLPAEEYDRLMFLHVRKDWQKFEGPLFTSKWFDYRFMNPVAATYQYAADYVRVYKLFFRATIDRAAAEFVRPLKDPDLFKCPQTTISAIWRGRQHADAMGMPYTVYQTLAMESVLKYWKQRHLPRPCQLYSNQVCERVAAEWEKRQLGILYFGAHSAYRMQRYVGAQVQDDHHEWLFDQAAKRQNSFLSLLDMVENNLLPLDKIKLRFGEDVAQRILQAA